MELPLGSSCLVCAFLCRQSWLVQRTCCRLVRDDRSRADRRDLSEPIPPVCVAARATRLLRLAVVHRVWCAAPPRLCVLQYILPLARSLSWSDLFCLSSQLPSKFLLPGCDVRGPPQLFLLWCGFVCVVTIVTCQKARGSFARARVDHFSFDHCAAWSVFAFFLNQLWTFISLFCGPLHALHTYTLVIWCFRRFPFVYYSRDMRSTLRPAPTSQPCLSPLDFIVRSDRALTLLRKVSFDCVSPAARILVLRDNFRRFTRSL